MKKMCDRKRYRENLGVEIREIRIVVEKIERINGRIEEEIVEKKKEEKEK